MTELKKKLYTQKSMTLQDSAREYTKELEQLTREGTALALQLQQMNGEQLARELGLLQIMSGEFKAAYRNDKNRTGGDHTTD